MSKDVLHIIGSYLNSKDFYELKKLCNLSIDIYIKNANVEVSDHHEYMDELIARNLIPNDKVIEYAMQYDIPKYATPSYIDGNAHLTYKETCISQVNHPGYTIPKIVEYSYKYRGFCFNQGDLGYIFENDDVKFMKIVQNYHQKSNMSIEDYYARHHNNLWQLNYKHKIVHLMATYRTFVCYLAYFLCGCATGMTAIILADLFGLFDFITSSWFTMIPAQIGLACASTYMCDKLLKACVNLKLPL